MKLKRIYQIAAYVKDLEEGITFYEDILGAKFIEKYDPPGLAFFDFTGIRLLLEESAPKSTLYFWVEDIETAYTELQSKGVEFIDSPRLIFHDDHGVFGNPNEEEWMAFFHDPSDNTLALVSRKNV